MVLSVVWLLFTLGALLILVAVVVLAALVLALLTQGRARGNRRGSAIKEAKDPVLDVLAKASEGLVYTSETDAGFKPFAWKDGDRLTEERLRQLAGAEPGTAVEQTTLDAFFRLVPSEDRPRFQELAAALQGRLSGVQVYKVGDEAEKQVYIVGKAPDGRWAGLKTTVVET